MRGLLTLSAMAVSLFAFAARGIAADALVIASNVPGLAVGAIVFEAGEVDIPAGARASFLAESGISVTLVGPYRGVVELAGESPSRRGALGVIAGLLAPDKESRYALGGVRGFATVDGPGNALWVNTAHSARYCVDAGHELHLWRPLADQRRGARLTDLETGLSASITWNAGEATHVWPVVLAYRDRAIFLVAVDGQAEVVHVEVRLIRERFDSEIGRITWLAGQGCIAQAEAELGALRDRIAPFDLYLSTDRGSNPVLRIGDNLALRVKANRGAAIFCFYRGRAGTIALFPSRFSNGAWVEGNETLELPGERLPVPLQMAPPSGHEVVVCYGTSRDVTRDLPPALITGDFEPIAAELAERIDEIFGGLSDTRVASSRVELTVE